MSAVGPTRLADSMRANKCEHLLQVSLTAANMVTEITQTYHEKSEAELYDEFGIGADRRKESYKDQHALETIVKWAEREMRINKARAAFEPAAAAAGDTSAEAAPPPEPASSFRPAEDPLMTSGWPAMRTSDYWMDARERPVHPGDVSAMGRIFDHMMTTTGHIPRSWEGSLARAGRVLEEQCDQDQMRAWTLKNGIYSPHYSAHKDAPKSMLPPPKRARTDLA